MAVPPRRLAVLVFAFGVLAAQAGAVTEHCTSSPSDGAADGATSHSLLQVSKPSKARSKVQLTQTEEHKVAQHNPKQPTAAASSLPEHLAKRDIHYHTRHGVADNSALSFIQTGDIIGETKVSDVLSDLPVEFSPPEVRVGWRHGFADAAVLGSIFCLVAWVLFSISGACGRSLYTKFRMSQVVPLVELPKPECSTLSPSGFKEPLLPNTAVSFVVPLTLHMEENAVGSSKTFCFDIPRQGKGPAVSAVVTCQPEGNTWAKVQLFSGDDTTSPLASCCLVHSASDVESSNIQGAMMSWLSLLLHEKEDAEVAAVERTDSEGEITGPPQQSRVLLDGIAEDLISSSASSGLGSMRLEVRNGLGLPAGHLEPSSSGRYSLACHGAAVLDIEVKPNRSISFSKNGQVMALATHLNTRRNPESPELTGEEDEQLQVDIREGADAAESALLLTCALAMIVFKPKAAAWPNTNEEASLGTSCEATQVIEHGDGSPAMPKDEIQGVTKLPVFYQRQVGEVFNQPVSCK